MRKKLLFRSWLLLALMLVGAGSAWGESKTYDFTLANFTNSTLVSVNTDNKLEGVKFNSDNGNQNKIDCYQLTNPNDNLDLEGHFYVSNYENWYYSKNGAGLWQNNGNRALLIAGLAKGQIVSINFTGGSGIQKMGIRGVRMNKLDGSSVDAGDYIESDTKYVAASDGYISLLCSKAVFIKSITIEDAPNIYFTSNTGKDLTTENEEVELTAMSYTEPTLHGVPNGATVAWSVSNIRLAGFNWENTSGVNHDILFINTGTVSVTATVTYCGVELTASYTVVVSADNASYEVNAISGGGYEYTLTGKGKLQERVITSIPCMTMTFGANGGSYSNPALSAYSLTNITIVRDEVIDDTFVTTTIDENGWGHCWTVKDNNGKTVPYQGTFYKFEPTANGTLVVKGYQTSNNLTVLVDASNNYSIVAQAEFTSTTDKKTIEANLISGHVYYLYGNTPNTGVSGGWSKFLLNSFSFTSDFRFENAYYILQHGETSYSQAATGEATYSVECKGGVTGASVDNNGNVTNIQGENGAIIVTATNTAGASIYYVITVPSSYTEDVTYDFYTNKEGLGIADYQGDENDAESQKWAANYKVRTYTNRELSYLNGCVLAANKSIAGDNARYIPKSAGLVFTSAAKCFGTNAINTGTYESTDGKESYEVDEILKSMLYADVDNIDVAANAKVTIYYNSTMTIPQVPSGKIIRVYWQCYDSKAGQYILPSLSNENCYLTDMEGKTITGAFGIGKVVEYVSQGETKYRGETIFTIQTDNDNVEYSDITFKINDAGWTNFIKIEVLDEVGTSMVLSNQSGNSMRATNSAIVYDGKTTKTVAYKAGPNYANNAMMLNPVYTLDTTNGNLDATLTATAGPNNSWYDLTLTVNGGCGTAMIIQKMYDASNTYVLDEVITYIPVGILSTDMEFPKTWDFTSASLGQSSQYESMADDANYGSWNEGKVMTSFGTTSANSVNVNVNQSDNGAARATLLFASGSELTSGTTTIEEAKGVGFGWVNQLCAAGTPNNVTLTDDGVQMSRRGGGNGNPTVTIPSVPANSRIYVKSTLEPTLVRLNGTNISAPENSDAVTGVYRYDITAAGTVEIRWAGGVTVQKIAVTDILKDVNHLGFASESRNHNIDHSLNTELTNHNVKAYAVTANDVVTDGYNAVKVNLTEANQFTVVPEGQGVVLWNGATDDNGAVFQQPLFYPAMHIDPTEADQALAAEGKNMMVGMPEGGSVGAYDGNFANYIMAFRHYTYDSKTGSNGDIVTENFEAFYPVMNAGSIGTNKAYLHIDKNLLPTPIWEGGSTGGSGVKNMIYIGYIPEGENPNDEPTGINFVDNNGVENLDNSVWYNLSGQKLNGRPATSGVYIVNGKKVMIK